MRRAELCCLQVCDLDSPRKLIHIRAGKGGRDRDVPLSPKLLETLREYWRWMKPKTYLFPQDLNRPQVRTGFKQVSGKVQKP
jgi:integrase